MRKMKKTKKILPPTYFLIYLIAAFLLNFLFPGLKIIPRPYNFLGIPLVILGIILTVWADQLFKKRKTTVKPFEKPSLFITEGPFRFSRHPMYLGFVMTLFGLAFGLGNVIAFLAPVAMFITFELLFIPQEEKSMEETFGQEYLEYKKRVRQWL